MVATIEVSGFDPIMAKFQDLLKLGGDCRPVFESIASDFYKGQEALVFSARPGKFADLRPRTKVMKQKKVGFVYPVLVMTGRLKNSLTKRGGGENVTVLKPTEMSLGTKVPYASLLQEGTRRMTARPPLLLDVGGRKQRWLRILETELQRRLSGGR